MEICLKKKNHYKISFKLFWKCTQIHQLVAAAGLLFLFLVLFKFFLLSTSHLAVSWTLYQQMRMAKPGAKLEPGNDQFGGSVCLHMQF